MKDKQPLIMCVDDDKDFLESLTIILKTGGYRVQSAASAKDGVVLYRKQRPDLILVDLMMEEVDSGTGFVKDLKAMGPTPPIYMLSSVGDNLNLATDYSQLGLNGVLQKPINPDVLLSTLRLKLKA